MDRIQWDDLPGSLKDAISARTGPVVSGRAVTDGQNSPLAAIVETGSGKVFVKGIPADDRRSKMLGREAAASPLVRDISPPLLWDFEEAGWKVLGFEYLEGRSASYKPGSADLSPVVSLMKRLGKVTVPEGHGPVKHADRWRDYVDRSSHVALLDGTSLSHTDWMPDNVLISDGRAWLVDWAWATRAAAFIDPACWVLRMIAWGHPVREAEAWGCEVESYARATGEAVNAWIRVNVNMWDEIVSDHWSEWAETMRHAARTWAGHRM